MWNANAEHKETANEYRDRLNFVLGEYIEDFETSVGKHEARNWASLKDVYEEARKKCPRAADTIAWLLWWDIVNADRFALLTEQNAESK